MDIKRKIAAGLAFAAMMNMCTWVSAENADAAIELPAFTESDIELPNYIDGDRVTWASSDPGAISTVGNVSRRSTDSLVTLTAFVKDENENVISQKDFNVTVTGEKPVYDENDKNRFDMLKLYGDKVLKYGRDSIGKTPLFADGVETDSETAAIFRYFTDADDENTYTAVLSNAAAQGNLMRTLYGLTYLTGDSKYADAVREACKYFLDNCIAPNGLPYWGGHTAMNLASGQPFFAPNDKNTHELKGENVFWQAFFDADTERSAEIVKTIWTKAIPDFSTLAFNRHHSYNDFSDNTASWDNTGVFDSEKYPLVRSMKYLTFRGAADNLISMAETLYKNTGDEKGDYWAKKLAGCYLDLKDENTQLHGGQFTTFDGADGVKNPLTELEPIGHWWDKDPLPEYYTWGNYGDRAKNQLADVMAEQGYITENEKDKVIEPNILFDGRDVYGSEPYYDFMLSDINSDSADSEKIKSESIKSMAQYIRCAYKSGIDKFLPIMIDGTSILGLEKTRNGYYGTGTIGYASSYTQLFRSYVKAYDKCAYDSAYANDKAVIWSYLKSAAAAKGFGNIGDTVPGENTELNFNTKSDDVYMLMGFIELYENTGFTDYLKMAETIGDNIVSKHCIKGYFGERGTKNIKLDNKYTVALVNLEAAIRGSRELVPDMDMHSSYFHCNYADKDGTRHTKVYDNEYLYTEKESLTDKADPNAYECNMYADFESGTDGFVYSDVSEENKGTAAEITADPEDAQNSCYEIRRTRRNKDDGDVAIEILQGVIKDSNGNTERLGGKLKFSARLRCEEGNSFWLNLKFDNEYDNITSLRLNGYTSDKYIAYMTWKKNNDGDWGEEAVRINDSAIPTDRWFYITELIDTDRRTFDLYIDGILIGEGLPFFYSDSEYYKYSRNTVSKIQFYSDRNNSAVNKSFWIDDVYIGTLLYEYTISDVYFTGDFGNEYTAKNPCGYKTFFHDGFDTDYSGNWSFPNDDSGAGLYYGVDIENETEAENKILRMTRKENTGSNPDIKPASLVSFLKNENGENAAISGKFEVSVRMKSDEKNLFYFAPMYGQWDSLAELIFQNGNIFYSADVYDTEKNIWERKKIDIGCKYKPDTWFEIKLMMDSDKREFDFYMDGEKVNETPLPFEKSDPSGSRYDRNTLSVIRFNTDRNNTREGASLYIDDVFVKRCGEYIGNERVSAVKLLNNFSGVKEAEFVFAIYNGGRLSGIKRAEIFGELSNYPRTKFAVEQELPKTGDFEIKCFIMDGKSLKPLAEALYLNSEGSR